jgi:uncharacterized membrane-anchored protein YitT (DUF2179 family)
MSILLSFIIIYGTSLAGTTFTATLYEKKDVNVELGLK